MKGLWVFMGKTLEKTKIIKCNVYFMMLLLIFVLIYIQTICSQSLLMLPIDLSLLLLNKGVVVLQCTHCYDVNECYVGHVLAMGLC